MTLAMGLLLALFTVLAILVQSGGVAVTLDGLIQAALLPIRTRPVLLFFNWLTQVGTGSTGAVVALSSSALLWAGGQARLVGPLWLAFIGAEATTWSIKFMTARVRPPFLEGLTAGSPSFPSAHSTVAISVYGFLALVAANAGPDRFRIDVLAVATVLILLIGASRLVLSLHYFTDVVGGYLIGAFWLLAAWRWASQG